MNKLSEPINQNNLPLLIPTFILWVEVSEKLPFNNAIVKCNLSIVVNSTYIDGLWFLLDVWLFEIIS